MGKQSHMSYFQSMRLTVLAAASCGMHAPMVTLKLSSFLWSMGQTCTCATLSVGSRCTLHAIMGILKLHSFSWRKGQSMMSRRMQGRPLVGSLTQTQTRLREVLGEARADCRLSRGAGRHF